jgi:hypothetical protein
VAAEKRYGAASNGGMNTAQRITQENIKLKEKKVGTL